MNIALDYDDTFTRDPEFWLSFVLLCRSKKHNLYCVTARGSEHAQEVIDNLGRYIGPENCYFTNMQGKRSYMFRQGIVIDVWIDDNPAMIVNGISYVENSGLVL